jgi:nucleoside-diphosphate-sugar epimerase
MKSISILGAGWLGFSLGEKLLQLKYQVNASTTHVEKLSAFDKAGLKAFLIQLNDADEIDHSFWTETLILSFPPGKSGDYSSYSLKVEHILKQLPEKCKRVIMISSTSVYPKKSGHWNEDQMFEAKTPEAQSILDAEEAVLASNKQAIILRLSGLVGYERNPARFGTSRLPANEPVNMIHRDDAIGVIIRLLEMENIKGIFNVCSPVHPSRQAFYEAGAKELGVESPNLQTSVDALSRTIDCEKLISKTQYVFQKENPLDFWKDA